MLIHQLFVIYNQRTLWVFLLPLSQARLLPMPVVYGPEDAVETAALDVGGRGRDMHVTSRQFFDFEFTSSAAPPPPPLPLPLSLLPVQSTLAPAIFRTPVEPGLGAGALPLTPFALDATASL